MVFIAQVWQPSLPVAAPICAKDRSIPEDGRNAILLRVELMKIYRVVWSLVVNPLLRQSVRSGRPVSPRPARGR
uniref:Uncharacterized protein n=1 Tax=Ralstonia solanacearum TaxID=305 RepID=A0A0S4TQW9_RALSL|nr:protein of unknown function [Ralstonia solanacearum]